MPTWVYQSIDVTLSGFKDRGYIEFKIAGTKIHQLILEAPTKLMTTSKSRHMIGRRRDARYRSETMAAKVEILAAASGDFTRGGLL